MKNCLTVENAESLLGKTLTGVDKNGRRFPFHYYPLIVGKWSDGRYYYRDRNGVCISLDDGEEVPFGEAIESCK